MNRILLENTNSTDTDISLSSSENTNESGSLSYESDDIAAAANNDDDDYILTPKDTASAVMPKVAALFSILGSACIIAEVLADHRNSSRGRRNGSKATDRLLVSMSISDIVFSTAWFFSTWAAPKDTSPYIWSPQGTTATCTAQGFLVQLGWTATPLFNLSLSLYFLLIIKYNWHEAHLKRLDPWVHGIIWTLALALAIFPIPLELYNNSWEVCWIDSYPMDCKDYDDIPCERGEDAYIYALAFTIFPTWICLILSVVFMGMIYAAVRSVETAAMQGHIAGEQLSSVNRARSKLVGKQALWYIAVFYICFVPDAVSAVIYYVDNFFFYYLDLVAYTLVPAQGFLNFLVFLTRRETMHSRYGQFLRRILCCCCCCSGQSNPTAKRSNTTTGHESVTEVGRSYASRPAGLLKSIKNRVHVSHGVPDDEEEESELPSDYETGKDIEVHIREPQSFNT